MTQSRANFKLRKVSRGVLSIAVDGNILERTVDRETGKLLLVSPPFTKSLWSVAAIDVTYLLEEGSGRKLRRRTLTIPESSFRK